MTTCCSLGYVGGCTFFSVSAACLLGRVMVDISIFAGHSVRSRYVSVWKAVILSSPSTSLHHLYSITHTCVDDTPHALWRVCVSILRSAHFNMLIGLQLVQAFLVRHLPDQQPVVQYLLFCWAGGVAFMED